MEVPLPSVARNGRLAYPGHGEVTNRDRLKATAEAQRDSPVVPAKPSPSAQDKARTLRTEDGFPVHSFQTLLADLAKIAKNRIRPKLPGADSFDQITRPTPLQRTAFDLLGMKL